MNTQKINYESSSDEEDELIRITNKTVATSGLEKTLSISIGDLNIPDNSDPKFDQAHVPMMKTKQRLHQADALLERNLGTMSNYQTTEKKEKSNILSAGYLQKPNTSNYLSFNYKSTYTDNNNKIVYWIKPEFITDKKGNRVFFTGKIVDYPPQFHKWSISTQDNWKSAVRHEAIRPLYISLLRAKKISY